MTEKISENYFQEVLELEWLTKAYNELNHKEAPTEEEIEILQESQIQTI